MVTQPKDYEEKLWQIQSNAPTTKAILLPTDEEIYNIDLNARTIAVPKFLSVEKDHQAEVIYFQFDRYYDRIDLTTKCCVIQYTNAAGNSYIYPVPFYDVVTFADANKVIIPWCIQGAATAEAGIVKFAVSFYSIDPVTHTISYCLNTLVAQGEVLAGQNETELQDYTDSQVTLDSSLLELLQTLESLVNSRELAVHWIDV